MDELLIFGGLTVFFIGILLLLISLVLFLITIFSQENRKKYTDIALKLLIVGLLMGVVGFGVCFTSLTSIY